MATGKATRIVTVTRGATLMLAVVTALAGCSVEAAGAAEDRSFDTIERQRGAMSLVPADTSYDHVERNRATFGTQPDTSYDDIERLRAARTGN